MYPQDIATSTGLVQGAAEYEQQIGQAIEVFAGKVGNVFMIREVHDATFGTATDRA
jgi:hypothetical protein